MHQVLTDVSNIIGIIGVILILIVYYLASVSRMSADSLKYQLMNFIGAWLILFSLFFHWNLSSVLIEIAWISISLFAMYRLLFSKQ